MGAGEAPRLAQLFSFSSSVPRIIVQILILVGVSPHFGNPEYATTRGFFLKINSINHIFFLSLILPSASLPTATPGLVIQRQKQFKAGSFGRY